MLFLRKGCSLESQFCVSIVLIIGLTYFPFFTLVNGMERDESLSNGNEKESLVATNEMCAFCFDVLTDHFHRDASSKRETDIEWSSLATKRLARELIPHVSVPLFVTLNKHNHPKGDGKNSRPSISSIYQDVKQVFSEQSNCFRDTTSPANPNSDSNSNLKDNCKEMTNWKKSPNGGELFHHRSYSVDEYTELRGCIGTFSGNEVLERQLPSFVKQSAFHDSRFKPLSHLELLDLKVSVSLLVDFETLPKGQVNNWQVGKHGIIIHFQDDNGRWLDATYLPEVATQFPWSKTECLNSLYKKAGYSKPVSQRLMRNTQLTRYQSTKCEMTYLDYINHHLPVPLLDN